MMARRFDRTRAKFGGPCSKEARMPVVHATIRVDADGTISGKAPRGVPPGEYEAPIDDAELKPRPKHKRLNLPLHAAPWDDDVSLRREDIYGDDGR
jgi:hypothetical protein